MVPISLRLKEVEVDKIDMIGALSKRSRSFLLQQSAVEKIKKHEDEYGGIIIDSNVLEKYRSGARRRNS